ncbi:hypothetical protein HOI26_01905 [Candidatus Woesearchaeota archaeon]|jgi:hypothetical protein|nr:hypothetical protein [Candidatus Woesearchaeota archaeon]MBT5739831.1 hypothetical protein [Candidatus Woesearchaeota archaeon]
MITNMSLENLVNSSSQHNMGAVVQRHDGSLENHASDKRNVHEREAKQMYELVDAYLHSEIGEGFKEYITEQGKELVDIVGVGAGDLGHEGIVAAIYMNDVEGVIMSNYEGQTFSERVKALAKEYDVKEETIVEYVIAHELGHAAGYKTEATNEKFLSEYFSKQASVTNGKEREKYVSLAAIAQKREVDAIKAGK